MVKKTSSASSSSTSSTGAAGLLDNHLAQSVKESAQQIWLAGMGAFAKAQEEGSKVFEALVKEGTTLQKKTQGLAEDKISEVTGKMTAMADTVSSKAGQNWDKLEQIFEQRTAKAMGKLGVPSAKDFQALVQRVDALTAQIGKAAVVAKPRAASAAAKATAVAKRSANKPAAKVARAAKAAKTAKPAAAKKAVRRARKATA